MAEGLERDRDDICQSEKEHDDGHMLGPVWTFQ